MQDILSEIDRNCDIVFCIDGTGSMGSLIENVKSHVKRFAEEFMEKMASANSRITSLRTKVIVFRDYGVDEDAMTISDFFDITTGADQELFEAEVNKIEARGGGDIPENGLEALYYAMTSDFFNKKKDRQLIVLFTDADCLGLRFRADSPRYPADMVDLEGFEDVWSCKGATAQTFKLGFKQKRMCLFAPEGTFYEDLSNLLDKVYFTPVDPGKGLADLDFSEIMQMMVASAASA